MAKTLTNEVIGITGGNPDRVVLRVEIDVRKLAIGPLTALNETITALSCIPHVDVTQVAFAETKAVVQASDLALSLIMRQGVERERAWSKAYLLWLRLLATYRLQSWCTQCRHPVAGDAGARHKEHANELVVERSALVGLGDPSLLSFDDCAQLETQQLIAFLEEVRKAHKK